MLKLFKFNKKIPSFDYLKDYKSQNLYFRRIASWAWLNNDMIFVMDPNAPRFITLDPWPQKIFLAAEGQKRKPGYRANSRIL